MENIDLSVVIKNEIARVQKTHDYEVKRHTFLVTANESRIENLLNRRDMLAADGCVMACRHEDAKKKLAAVAKSMEGVAV